MKIPRLFVPSLILAVTLLGCGTVLAQQKTVLKETEMKDLAELRARADQGDADAQSILGGMYANGQGVAKDEVEAVKWYRKAAEQNHAAAQFALGGCYYTGQGVEKDYTEAVQHWIDVGQPDDKRLMRAAGRAERVSVYSFSSSTPVWWKAIETKLTRASNLVVWQIEAAESQALARLAERGMQLQISIQDGSAYVSAADASVEIHPVALKTPAE